MMRLIILILSERSSQTRYFTVLGPERGRETNIAHVEYEGQYTIVGHSYHGIHKAVKHKWWLVGVV